jgi:hypothetical protein
VHQVLLCVADGAVVLNFAASCQGRLETQQLVEVRRILHSFQFEQPDASSDAVPDAGDAEGDPR